MADWQDAVARGERPLRPISPKRHRVMQQGRIVLGRDTLIACMVRDLTPVGAKIRLPRPLSLPETFDLIIAAHDLRTIPVRLRWQRGLFVGLTFVERAGSRET